ncbi:MAG: retropepsin-like aspartic protease [Rhodospirillaceae bacterium]
MSDPDHHGQKSGRRAVLHVLAAVPWLATPFAAAAGLGADTTLHFAGDETATPWMAFDMPDLRHIILAGTINGRPARIMLDSGVGTFALTRTYAAGLGLSPAGYIHGAGGGAGQRTDGLRVGFANLTFATKGAAIFDIDAAQAAPGPLFDALIGRDLFDALLVDIDFGERRIAFRRSDGARSLPGGAELRLVEGDFGLRSMPVSIAGSPPIPALIDLGADRPFHLSPRYNGLAGLLEGRRVTTIASGGVGGIEIGRLVTLDRIAAAGVTFPDVPTEIPAHWAYQTEAIVGFPVFRRFRMLADFPFNRMCLRPLQTAQPFRKDRCGIGARRVDGRLEIVHVAAGSPAERAGLKAGEVIVAVNGQALTPAYFAQHPRDGARPAGTRFAFTLNDGSTRELVLKDYF